MVWRFRQILILIFTFFPAAVFAENTTIYPVIFLFPDEYDERDVPGQLVSIGASTAIAGATALYISYAHEEISKHDPRFFSDAGKAARELAMRSWHTGTCAVHLFARSLPSAMARRATSNKTEVKTPDHIFDLGTLDADSAPSMKNLLPRMAKAVPFLLSTPAASFVYGYIIVDDLNRIWLILEGRNPGESPNRQVLRWLEWRYKRLNYRGY